MNIAVVRSSFWRSSIVQHLRTVCPSDVQFRESATIHADITFPFCGTTSFSVLYPNNLNPKGVQELEEATKYHQMLVAIVCLSPDESDMYADFLTSIPVQVSALVCFPPDRFARKAATFIWETASKAKPTRRKLERLIEEKRNLFMNPDVQGPRILESLIADPAERARLQTMMDTETGTIRETLRKGIPELLERDFFIESGE